MNILTKNINISTRIFASILLIPAISTRRLKMIVFVKSMKAASSAYLKNEARDAGLLNTNLLLSV